MKTNIMKSILLKLFILLLSAFLITACSSNSGEGGEGDGTENGGNGNGNGDGGEEEEDELEGYIQFDWNSFEYVFNSLNDLRIHKYRLPFKNVDAKPEDYGWQEKADSVLYPGIIFGFVNDEIVPIDTNAYMVIYMESQQNSFYLSCDYFYEDGSLLGGRGSFYSGYKPKGVNFLYTSEDLWDFNVLPVGVIKAWSGEYYDVNEVMSIGIKHLYQAISTISTINTPDGRARYFIENFTKGKE